MRWNLPRRLVAAFFLPVLITLLGTIQSVRLTQQLDEGFASLRRWGEVLIEAEHLQRLMVDAETGQRGFVLTGDPRYLVPYDNALREIYITNGRLRDLCDDEPDLKARLDSLHLLMERKLAISARAVELRRTEGFDVAATVIRTGEGLRYADDIRRVLGEVNMDRREAIARASVELAVASGRARAFMIGGGLVGLAVVCAAGAALARGILTPVRNLTEGLNEIGKGNLEHRLKIRGDDEFATLSVAFNGMVADLCAARAAGSRQEWISRVQAEAVELLPGSADPARLGRRLLDLLAPLLGFQAGALYVADDCGADAPAERRDGGEPAFRVVAVYGSVPAAERAPDLLRQAARDGRQLLIDRVPAGYLAVSSGFGGAAPAQVLLQPATAEGRSSAVLELATFGTFTETHRRLLERLSVPLAIALRTLASSHRTAELLVRSRELTEELQTQQEQLKESNRRLEEQTEELATQQTMLQERNRQVEAARQTLEEQAARLAQASRYKSEFLANMSHELRTPLNSLLILSQLLGDNRPGNLTPQQLEQIATIRSAGSDLLQLINDVLDMAKVESGTLELCVEELSVPGLAESLERSFAPTAKMKGLDFSVTVADDAPERIDTDGRRLGQVLRNLLANAVKFTERGSVRMRIVPAPTGNALDFRVTDTGVGIPQHLQAAIFEPFRQGDSGTARKFGGTGLGLSISRELARRLGGQLLLESEPGRGSTFTLRLEIQAADPATSLPPVRAGAESSGSRIRPSISELRRIAAGDASTEADDPAPVGRPDDPLLLVVEDDLRFGRLLVDAAQEHRFRVAWAQNAAAAIRLAKKHLPAAVTLDLGLPDRSGRDVLAELRRLPGLEDVPVQIISGADLDEIRLPGASHVRKPVTIEELSRVLARLASAANRTVRRLLIVEPDPAERTNLRKVLEAPGQEVAAAETGREALERLGRESFDGLVVGLRLPDMSGLELIRLLRREYGSVTPVVIQAGELPTPVEARELERAGVSVVLREGLAEERLLAETRLFLERVRQPATESTAPAADSVLPLEPAAALPQGNGRSGRNAPAAVPAPPRPVDAAALRDRRVLVVDDDVRNVFALTAALEGIGMQVTSASSGAEGLEALEAGPDFDIVLMDIMMPEMDGFEAMRRIRAVPARKDLPILAVTAKAMAQDRVECLAAGADDVLTKPLDVNRLLERMLSLLDPAGGTR